MKKKLIAFITLTLLTVAFFVLGQYVAGHVYLKISHLPKDSLNFWTIYDYYTAYGHDPEYKKTIGGCLVLSILITLIPFFTVFIVLVTKKKPSLHGDARFASDLELKKSGLLQTKNTIYVDHNGISKPPIILGKVESGAHKDKFCYYAGSTFLGVAAGTRGGKGVSIVITNLVTYQDSAVVLDIKLENFESSAGYRAQAGQEIYLFCPDGYTHPNHQGLRSHCYNPFDAVRYDKQRIYLYGDIERIAKTVYPDRDDKSGMWNQLAQSLFIGLSLWMYDVKDIKAITPSFAELYRLLRHGALEEFMAIEIEMGYLSEDTVIEFNKFISSAKETRGSILSTFVAPLAIFADKACIAATSKSDFSLDDLRRKRMTVYVGVNPDNMKRYQFLINIFFEQMIGLNTRVEPKRDKSLKYQCLVMFDEFAKLGKLNSIVDAVSYSAGYNLRFAFVYQGNSQLREIYGKDGAATIIKNLGAEIAFPPAKVDEDVKAISETLGYQTVKHKTRSRTSGRNVSRTQNITEQKRALMLPQEFVEFGMDDILNADTPEPLSRNAIVIKEYIRPFKIKKAIFFEHERLKERADFAKKNIPEPPLLPIQGLDNDHKKNDDIRGISDVVTNE